MKILANPKAVRKKIFAFENSYYFSRPTLEVIDGVEISKGYFLRKYKICKP